ncbi:hypothetical protein HB364_23720 [Pseudoflavitalea sp. X16]|uniref:hypothetical protein n=1 Tax=Paraflavitalea devenefica TaxID=2716334 RepID=UPI00141D7580|nr:hypothetical protein [Paraflavitalea devenefica]NII28112.1 hypothetical protein [Paraflavitalea devenefica]
MLQYSTNSSPIEIQLVSGHLLLIDPLYFQDIIDKFQSIDMPSVPNEKEFVRFLEDNIFPYGGGGLLGYKYVSEKKGSFKFNPASLKKWDPSKESDRDLAKSKDITTIGVDSASFIIIDLKNFEKLTKILTYDDITTAQQYDKLDIYFDAINKIIGNKGWALIFSEGVDTQTEFDGDGSYIIP